jgi:putative MATE family efflux protein
MKTELERRLALETPFSPMPEEDARRVRADVWRIAWPSVLTFSLGTTNAILDRGFVGKLGTDALAAVAVGGQVLFLLVSLSMSISVGTTALVARFTGAGQPEAADRATGQSLALAALLGVLFTLGISLTVEPLLRAMFLAGGAQAQCRAFLNMALIGMTPMFMGNAINAAFRGMGDTRTPLKVMICANLVHIGGDWVLMLGHFGAPRLGLPGGGIAMSASAVVSLAVYLWIMRRSSLAGALRGRHLLLTMEWTRRVLKIGIPAAFTALLRTTSMMGFTGVLARTAERTSAVASLPIGMTGESISFMPGLGFSVAASALVGQALGARNPQRAERYGWSAAWMGVAIMSAMGVVFFLAAEPFSHLFTKDPTVLRLAVSYLRIMAISEPMLAFGMILTGALQGAGDTLRPTILTGINFWIIRLPAAWFLALYLHLNANGAWIAMAGTTILGGFLTIWLFKQDSWKKIKV